MSRFNHIREARAKRRVALANARQDLIKAYQSMGRTYMNEMDEILKEAFEKLPNDDLEKISDKLKSITYQMKQLKSVIRVRIDNPTLEESEEGREVVMASRSLPKCDQCDSATINGVYCHEQGCHNKNKSYSFEDEAWVNEEAEEE